MRLAIFLVYLCSLLLRLDGHIHADTQHRNIRYTLTRSFEKGQPGSDALISNSDTDNNPDCFFDDRDDDSEDERSSAAQHLALYCNAARPFQSILLYLYNSFKAPPYYYGPVSYKYIEQRVLRL